MDNGCVAIHLQQPVPTSHIAEAVDRYFQISLFLLISTGFITLISTGRLDPVSVLFVSLALVFRGIILLRKSQFNLPEKWSTYLTLLYVLVFVLDLFFVSESYVTASIHMVLFAMVVKLFSIRRERDYVYLAVLSFLAVLASSLLTVDTVFVMAFVAFILLAVNTFVSMEIRRSLRKSRYRGHEPVFGATERKFGLALSATGAVLVICILVISAGMFFLIPRFNAGYLSGYAPRGEIVTGFSDQVNLGAIGRIQQSDSVVMHVQFDSPPPANLKFRGVALTVFDGQTWSNVATDTDNLNSNAGRYDFRAQQFERQNLARPPYDQQEIRLLRYRVLMEPIGTNAVFLAPVPIQLQAKFRLISIDENGAVANVDRARGVDTYEATSQIMTPRLQLLKSASGNYPARIEMMYLQPASLDPRVHDLALQAISGMTSDYEKAVALESYLGSHFTYTLQLPSRTPKDPIAHFLFVRKQGHCEYFASAMAVMLRSIGIPSRLVNGFRNGEYNDLTGNYVVRARNAHTWVEAYIPSVGWMAFDPTPADPAPTETTWSRVQMYLDAAQSFWREWVINYDFQHQRELTVSTATKAQKTVFDLRKWARSKYNSLLRSAKKFNSELMDDPTGWGSLGVVIVLLGATLWKIREIYRFVRQRRIASRPARSPRQSATIWYSRMLKAVAKQGYAKPPTKTPQEFAGTIPEVSLRDSITRFTERYERARFGESIEDAEQLPVLYEEIAGKK
jgi:protein-glutamine gamma-glutamyltransferase